MAYLSPEFNKNIAIQIQYHHNLYTSPPKGTFWENLVFNACSASNHLCIWNSDDHVVGEDMIIDGNRVSIKTGQYTKKHQFIKYNSYRTTTYKELSDKMKYFDSKESHIDYYLYCIPNKQKSDNTLLYYDICYNNIPIDIFQYEWMKYYKKSGEFNGWKSLDSKSGNMIYIINNMSDQFWCEITSSNFIKLVEVSASVNI